MHSPSQGVDEGSGFARPGATGREPGVRGLNPLFVLLWKPKASVFSYGVFFSF